MSLYITKDLKGDLSERAASMQLLAQLGIPQPTTFIIPAVQERDLEALRFLPWSEYYYARLSFYEQSVEAQKRGTLAQRNKLGAAVRSLLTGISARSADLIV